MIRGIITGLLVMVIGLLGGMILSILGLFPLIGPIAAGISLLIWAPFLICFDICEVGFTRQGYAFKQRINALRSMPFATISVGLVATFLISIPFLNLIGLPLAVVIGTLHVRRLSQNA